MNSSSESLYFGVPMLVIPVMGDQPIVAQRIEELEAGVQLDRNLLTPEILRNTAMHVLSNDIYIKNSHRIGESLKMLEDITRQPMKLKPLNLKWVLSKAKLL